MAVGDSIFVKGNVSAGAVLTVQPSSGVEGVFQGVAHEGTIEVQSFDGSTVIVCGSQAGADLWGPAPGVIARMSNAEYFRVKNMEGSAKNIKAWYVQTK